MNRLKDYLLGIAVILGIMLILAVPLYIKVATWGECRTTNSVVYCINLITR